MTLYQAKLSKLRIVFVVAVFFCTQTTMAHEFNVGYGLMYSLNRLNTSKIDSGFSEVDTRAHSSYFFIGTQLSTALSLEITPGALNLEDGDVQFHAQYNAISLNYKPRGMIFPLIRAGLGGCIATLTEGNADYGEVQTGLFVRNSVFIWSGAAGIGYRFGKGFELTLETRGIGFFDDLFRNLNLYGVGLSISKQT